uniref:Outer membrane protein beta-barrel domain-containing protein n=1 Tax=Prevotella sp. GTC17254 TaxID=3236794 RepID=A0AB33IWM4_9BACT
MKQTVLLLILLFCSAEVPAQDEKTVDLDGIEVRASRVIIRPDGRRLIPSDKQKAASTSGYSLLNKLSLPNLRVDEVTNSITALGNKGMVQVLINNRSASVEDMLSLSPQSVKSVDFIENPGLRYGTDVAYVVHIHTLRAVSGYTVGFNGLNSLTTLYGHNTVYGQLNRGNSEFGVSYNSGYVSRSASDYDEQSFYHLADQTVRSITRRNVDGKMSSLNHGVQLKYTLADSSSYVFQALLNGQFSRIPKNSMTRELQDGTDYTLSHSSNRETSSSPSLDLYFYRALGKRQELTLNVVGTLIDTYWKQTDDEGEDYRYSVDGKTYSLLSEAVYEHRLQPFTFSLGAHYSLKYTANQYSGNVESLNHIHTSSGDVYGEIAGSWGRLRYKADVGITQSRYRQDGFRDRFWMFRPKFSLGYPMTDRLYLSYTFDTYKHVSRIALTSDARIRQNSMEWLVGNPNLQPARLREHQARFTYQTPRLTANLVGTYRLVPHSNMVVYERTNDNLFIQTQRNQRGVSFLVVQATGRYDVIPEKLIVSMNGGINRFWNRGDAYTHTYTSYSYGASVQAYLGKWMLMGIFDNGWSWMEGEGVGISGSVSSIQATYRIRNGSISLHWNNPFQAHPRSLKSEVRSSLIQKYITTRYRHQGNMVSLNFTWRLSRGQKYRDVQRTLQNKETDAGILK